MRDLEKKRAAWRAWYLRNKDKETSRYKVKTHYQRDRIRKFIEEQKAGKTCSKCPESFAPCLDFHHKNPKTKEFSIANTAALKKGKKKILAEMEKCVLLCANCHRKEHYGV